MDTKNLQDLLVDYLYEELPPEQRAEYEAALQESPDLQVEIEALQRTREAFAALDELEVPSAISDRLLAEAARAVPQQPSFLQRLRSALQLLVLHPAMSAAVVMVAVLGVSFYVYRHGAPPTALPEADPLRPLPAAPAAPAPVVAQAEPTRADKTGKATQGPQTEGLRRGLGYRQAGGKAAPQQQKAQLAQAARVAGSSTPGRGQGALSELPKKQQAYKSPLRPRARARRAARRSMDSMGNTASDRRERRDYNRKNDVLSGNQAALPSSVAPRPKPAAKRAPAKAKGGPKTAAADKEAEASRGWLRLGHQAATANRCAVAFDYYTRALRAEPSLLGQISARLGSCRGQLSRSAAHRWLAARIHGQERRPARRKAKRRVLSPQQRLESK